MSASRRAPTGPPAGSAGILPAQRRVRRDPTSASPRAGARDDPPGAHRSVPRVRPPACTDDAPRREPKRPPRPPSSVHMRVPRWERRRFARSHPRGSVGSDGSDRSDGSAPIHVRRRCTLKRNSHGMLAYHEVAQSPASGILRHDALRRAPKRPLCPPSSVHPRVPPLGAPESCRPSGVFVLTPSTRQRRCARQLRARRGP